MKFCKHKQLVFYHFCTEACRDIKISYIREITGCTKSVVCVCAKRLNRP